MIKILSTFENVLKNRHLPNNSQINFSNISFLAKVSSFSKLISLKLITVMNKRKSEMVNSGNLYKWQSTPSVFQISLWTKMASKTKLYQNQRKPLPFSQSKLSSCRILLLS